MFDKNQNNKFDGNQNDMFENNQNNQETNNFSNERENNSPEHNFESEEPYKEIIKEDTHYEFWAENVAKEERQKADEVNHLKANDISHDDTILNNEDTILSSNDNQYNTSYQNGINDLKQSVEEVNRLEYSNYDYNSKHVKKQNKLMKKIVSLVVSAAVFGVVAGTSFIGIVKINNKINPDKASTNIATTIQANNTSNNKIESTSLSTKVNQQKNDVSDVVSNTMPSIVSIKSSVTQTYQDWFGQTYDKDSEGSGSGIIVGKNNTELLVATNNHVVAGANTIKVTFIDEAEYTAELKGTDETADLAVVAIKLKDISNETLNKIKIATLGNSDDIMVGQMAIAIGNALGYGQSVTVGYISAKDRTVQITDKQSMLLLQTDAAINPGNSGGALLNIKGEVIGINTVKFASNEVEGMGYAIPISKATPIINDLMNREILKEGEQGYLGVTGNDVTTEVSMNYNMPVGVYINEVVEDGAASKAGIKVGDIITEVNDIAVQSITALREKVNSYRVGTEISITLMRNTDGEYKEQVVKVTLGKAPKNATTSETNKNGTQNGSSDNSSNNNDSNAQNPNIQKPEQQNPEQQNPNSNGESGNSSESFFDYYRKFFE